ncbi:MAG: DUF1203 domain-containing protein [Dokdonella sp.]
MTATFQLVGLAPESFESLFDLNDDELRKHGAVRRIAKESPGFPCRISLEDAEVGEELLLLSYMHQPASSPYRATGPIFIRSNVEQRHLPAGEIPNYVSGRLMSVRAYDAEDMMIEATVCEGTLVAGELERLFDDTEVAYVHLHNAKQGCFSCAVTRV